MSELNDKDLTKVAAGGGSFTDVEPDPGDSRPPKSNPVEPPGGGGGGRGTGIDTTTGGGGTEELGQG